MATKKLRKGDTVVLKNRMYGLVDEKGRLCLGSYGQEAAIYPTRREARQNRQGDERGIRLADVSGTIV